MAAQDIAPPLLTRDRLDEVEGWFFAADVFLFDWLLAHQRAQGICGDLLELGVYKGKSAILIGFHAADGERFTVCDLFDAGEAPDDSTATEMRVYYPTLTRQVFEANYLRFHRRLPTVIQSSSSGITTHVPERSCRFVHIDASHLYHHVRVDIAAARQLLTEDGIVSLDDFRSPHTPGVAAATWEAVLTIGLKPVVLTENKLYGTWGSPNDVRDTLADRLATHPTLWGVTEDVAGHTLLRVHSR
ncbi:class I SAM-dependent methyltransferase [Streptomyces sp. BPTC-684]|uniref:class I SAM-dependent methyltransferase n=1 Tax=Streptomyces sp. BPTC-684 TaxID=3043734 RepID=UPI0024B0E81D|nr:class I SAM-dependent methyltransferase [Streptomyces sp. BPTC-684]WHM41086.1 class I SAM-dependent methyltransferase [Streptomyces sp. BPTC-684]